MGPLHGCQGSCHREIEMVLSINAAFCGDRLVTAKGDRDIELSMLPQTAHVTGSLTICNILF